MHHHLTLLPLLLLYLYTPLVVDSKRPPFGRPQYTSTSTSTSSSSNSNSRKRSSSSIVDGNISESVSVIASHPQPSSLPPLSLNALELCICGAVSTMIGDFVMHPIDTIKIVQQTSATSFTFLSAASHIFKTSGIVGFFPGVVPYLTCDGISGAIKFATFELSRVFVVKRIPGQYHPVAQFVCAAAAMLCCSLTLVPGEVLKIRLQSGAVKSLADGVASILKTDGIKGFYAGYGATLVRDVPFTMLELGIYENLKTLIKSVVGRSTLTSAEELGAAAFTGGSVAFVTTPLDLIKTKLTMQSTSGGRYSGVMDAMQSVYREGGGRALFVGSTARVAWLLPFTTIYLGIYEVLKRNIIEAKTKKRNDSIR